MAKGDTVEVREPVFETLRSSQEWDSRQGAAPPEQQTVVEIKRVGWIVRDVPKQEG